MVKTDNERAVKRVSVRKDDDVDSGEEKTKPQTHHATQPAPLLGPSRASFAEPLLCGRCANVRYARLSGSSASVGDQEAHHESEFDSECARFARSLGTLQPFCRDARAVDSVGAKETATQSGRCDAAVNSSDSTVVERSCLYTHRARPSVRLRRREPF